MRWFPVIVVATVALGPRAAGADDRSHALAGDPVTDEEIAAAKRDGVGCADLAALVDGSNTSHSQTHWKLMVKYCKRDRWPLAIVVCYLRDRGDHCSYRLPVSKQKKIDRALDRAAGTIAQEQRAWAIEAARNAGVLGTTTLQPGWAFEGLHGHTPGDDGPPPPEPPRTYQPPPLPPEPSAAELAAKAGRATIDAWAQTAYEQCTDGSRNLSITVTVRAHACTDIKVAGERRTGEITKCLRALCAGADWSATPDIRHDAHGRTTSSVDD